MDAGVNSAAGEREAAGQQLIQCDLETGRLQVSCESAWAGESLPFGLAERNNPRRAFLFVSRVLGRHVPIRPALMRQAFTALADDIPADLPGPIVITGMAETAVGLGAGVHDAFLARTGRDDVLFLSTTRARFDAAELTSFREEHSHASGHQVYRPQHVTDRALLDEARSLVMVDDEASSGDTFANLSTALIEAGLDRLERVHTTVLTDWRGGVVHSGALSKAHSLSKVHSGASSTGSSSESSRSTRWTCSALLYGHYEWLPFAGAPQRTLPDADQPRVTDVSPIARDDDGRLGRSRRSSISYPDALLECLQAVPDEARGITLVLGTGEHVWEPFLLAEALEREGHDVRFGATTRSPILPGHEVRRGMAFADHEGLGITNYLYNVDPHAFSQVVLCVDTSLAALDPRLLAALRPHVLEGDVFHDWSTLAAPIGDVEPAAGFDIGPAVADA